MRILYIKNIEKLILYIKNIEILILHIKKQRNSNFIYKKQIVLWE